MAPGEAKSHREMKWENYYRKKVWQAEGSDGDDTNEGPYTIQIISDSDGIGGQEASPFGEPIEDVPNGTLKTIPLSVQRQVSDSANLDTILSRVSVGDTWVSNQSESLSHCEPSLPARRD